MAQVHITFRDPTQAGASSILSRDPAAAETITSSGVSQQTAIVASGGQIAHIDTDGAVFVKVGSNPTAASGDGDIVRSVKDIGFLKQGDRIAVIDA